MASDSEIYIPSIEACRAFGINRLGVKKQNFDEKYSFLNGPQFANLEIYQYEEDKMNGSVVGKNCLDEIVIKFLGNTPIALVPEKDPETGIVRMRYPSHNILNSINNPLFTIRLIPHTNEWLEFNINHKWDESDGLVSKIIETAQQIVDGINSVVQVTTNVVSGITQSPYKTLKKIVTDKQDQYISTDKISFNIPFMLFTSGKATNGESEKDFIDRWLRDIYKPLVVLTAWTHPKRATELVNENGIKVTLGELNPDPSNPQNVSKNQEPSIQERLLQISSMYPGVRAAISEPPSYVSVEHSAGFFKFDVCAIDKISYKFQGPWIRASVSEEDINQSLNNEHFSTTKSQILDVTLPLLVSGNIGIKVIEKMYADDWISMFENSPLLSLREGGKNIINITKNMYAQRNNQENS